jgi:ubiquinol-cytochrome c reductase cytochrome b subunit
MLRPYTRDVFDWLDDRTGYRTLLQHLLDEPLPHGTGWVFTTGSILLLLLAVQFVTGVALAMYYVPTPLLAYDSVRFITDTLSFGWLLRGIHFWGASFIVVASGVHMLRVFFYASYKAPREVTWLTGVVMLLLILAFSLSGYLLPWDQKAYWATTVTINIAAGTPFIGAGGRTWGR